MANKPKPKKKPVKKPANKPVVANKPKPTGQPQIAQKPTGMPQKPQVAQKPSIDQKSIAQKPTGMPQPQQPGMPMKVDPMMPQQPAGFMGDPLSIRPTGIPVPRELSQMPTYINDPAKLSGEKNLSPFKGNPTGYNIAALDPNINPANTTPVVQKQSGLGAPQVAQQPGGISPTGMPSTGGEMQPQVQQPGAPQPGMPGEQPQVAQQPGGIPANMGPGSMPQTQGQQVAQKPLQKGGIAQPNQPQVQQPEVAQQPVDQPNVAQKPNIEQQPATGPIQANMGPESLVAQQPGGTPNGTVGLQPNQPQVMNPVANPLQPPVMPPMAQNVDQDSFVSQRPQVMQRPNSDPMRGFAGGGFTGDIPENKPAGVVHGGEYVFPADVVDALGIDFLEGLKNQAQSGFRQGGLVPGYKEGGPVEEMIGPAGEIPKATGPLSFEEWKKTQKGDTYATPNHGDGKTKNAKHAYEDFYVKNFKEETKGKIPAGTGIGKITAGEPKYQGQINVADYGSNLVEDPELGFSKEMKLSENIEGIDENAAGTNISKTGYGMNEGGLEQTASQAQTAQAGMPEQGETNTYEAQTTQENIEQNGQMEAAQGELSEGAIIDESEVPQHDVDAHARGETELGKALDDYAKQELGEVDPLATMRGQLELLQSEFVDPVTGEPKIPAWAAASARGIAKLAAFKGMTGTAATAAMSQAMMEASLPIAQQEAQFFQTLTLKNLDNKQASIINKANVLSKMELTNVDNRMAAVIQNSKNFMEMDMKNLDNRQQAQILNQQARVQSIFEDAKAVNTQRMFTAQSENDMDMFYSELGSQVEMFNATQKNNMSQYNTSEKNAMKQFNASMENQREQFEKTMSYNIDVANAKWRQTVTLTESDQKFQAAAVDARNMVDMSTEQLNRLWDRSDNLLQFIHTSSENEMDRKAQIAMTKLKGKLNEDAAEAEGWGSVFGTVAGKVGSGLVDWLF